MKKAWKRPPAYNIWVGMKGRCYNEKCEGYPLYGGRGISVCDRWKDSFSAFIEDMGPRPDGHSIDRIDPNGNYTPDNCRWADSKTQTRNTRRTIYVQVEGIRYTAIDLAEISGQKVDTIVDRARKNLRFSEVISPTKRYDTSGLSLGGKASGAKKLARTHCRNGHELTPENTYWRSDNSRQCRECHNAKMRRLNAKKRLSSPLS